MATPPGEKSAYLVTLASVHGGTLDMTLIFDTSPFPKKRIVALRVKFAQNYSKQVSSTFQGGLGAPVVTGELFSEHVSA